MLVLVTGASRGIGAAVAQAFAARGARLALVARDADALAAVAERCAEAGGEARAFRCDVTDADAVETMATAVRDWAGTPDVVVNNAGHFEPGGLLETSPEAFRRQLDVNVVSAFLVTRAFLGGMLARGSGRVLMMGSVASVRGYPGGSAYGAAKHALLGLARAVREETKGTGVSVTTLLPGATRTGSWDGTDLPDDRFIPPDDVARVAVEVATLSGRTVVEEVLLRPDAGDI
ncbi:SDR family NAD(P)-dependent oxidoreductase [Rubrivirga sp.]|uniref:SDR family NAD(P)-dependent oxidoreductase n=1 Tax=Rubrivirga sp. TaxID=1885344 RepID=UPI003B5232BD